MNSEVVATLREALGAARHNVVMHYNKISDAPARIARIDTALHALDEAAIPADVMQVAIECIDSERNATANMMDAWNEKSDRYKRYAAEVARYEMALMWFEQRKRQPAQEEDA